MFVVFDSLPRTRSISYNFGSGHCASGQNQTRTWHASVAISLSVVIKLVKEKTESLLHTQSDRVDIN